MNFKKPTFDFVLFNTSALSTSGTTGGSCGLVKTGTDGTCSQDCAEVCSTYSGQGYECSPFCWTYCLNERYE
ncbi:MAG: hypothetical protein Q4C49_11150 [Bacillota bacterium]|nr:hypothetical protein [Bacillota bacterium]